MKVKATVLRSTEIGFIGANVSVNMAVSRHEGRRYLNARTSDVRIEGCRLRQWI